MQWIEKVEIAISIDDLMTSRSITRRTEFPDCDMLDAKIASALNKIITSVHFRMRVTVEEQRAQKYDRFLRGRQIAYMIYEYFRAARAYQAVQGLSDLFNTRLHNDDVQEASQHARYTFEKEQVSKSSVLRSPTDSYEENKLRT